MTGWFVVPLAKNFQENQRNSTGFPTFPVFGRVVDILNQAVSTYIQACQVKANTNFYCLSSLAIVAAEATIPLQILTIYKKIAE